jgi:hypothetical protein
MLSRKLKHNSLALEKQLVQIAYLTLPSPTATVIKPLSIWLERSFS